MTIITITEGQIVWFIGVAFVVFGLYMFFRFYDPNYNINAGLIQTVVLIIGVGAIMILGGLNLDYHWIEIEVKK